MMTAIETHVVFSESARGELGKALAVLGRAEPVVVFPCDLSYGPPDTVGGARARWLEETCGLEPSESDEDATSFWDHVAHPRAAVVVWMSSRDVTEVCGLGEIATRCSAIRVVDVARLTGCADPGWSERAGSFGYLGHSQIVNCDLVSRVETPSLERLEDIRSTWRALRADNAELRVLTADGVRSEAASFFDDLIVAEVGTRGVPLGVAMRRVVARLSDGTFKQVTSERFLLARCVRLPTSEGLLSKEMWTPGPTTERSSVPSAHEPGASQCRQHRPLLEIQVLVEQRCQRADHLARALRIGQRGRTRPSRARAAARSGDAARSARRWSPPARDAPRGCSGTCRCPRPRDPPTRARCAALTEGLGAIAAVAAKQLQRDYGIALPRDTIVPVIEYVLWERESWLVYRARIVTSMEVAYRVLGRISSDLVPRDKQLLHGTDALLALWEQDASEVSTIIEALERATGSMPGAKQG